MHQASVASILISVAFLTTEAAADRTTCWVLSPPPPQRLAAAYDRSRMAPNATPWTASRQPVREWLPVVSSACAGLFLHTTGLRVAGMAGISVSRGIVPQLALVAFCSGVAGSVSLLVRKRLQARGCEAKKLKQRTTTPQATQQNSPGESDHGGGRNSPGQADKQVEVSKDGNCKKAETPSSSIQDVHSVADGGGRGGYQRSHATGQDAPYLYLPKGLEKHAWGGMQREVVCADALVWLAELPELPGALFTSLPDITELNMEGREEEYKEWFVNAAALALSKLPERGVALFYQTDVKLCWAPPMTNEISRGMREGALMSSELIDKSFLCQLAAQKAGCRLLWRKVVCKGHVDAPSVRRPAYTHLLCFCKGEVSYDTTYFALPDVLPRGLMVWPKAIGVDAAIVGARFLREVMKIDRVVDPFCGTGTILAAANIVGMHALGVDLSLARTERALRLCLQKHVLSECYDEGYRGMLPMLRTLVERGEIPPASSEVERITERFWAQRRGNEAEWKRKVSAGKDSGKDGGHQLVSRDSSAPRSR